MKKLNLTNAKNTLSRDEMKKVMAGSGTGGCNGACEGVRLSSGGACLPSVLKCGYYSGYCEPCCSC
jgi:hypothetical protein